MNLLSKLNLVSKSDFDNLEEDYNMVLTKNKDLDTECDELFSANYGLGQELMKISCELHYYKFRGLPIALFCGVAIGYFLR